MNTAKKLWWLISNTSVAVDSILMEDSGSLLMEDSGSLLTE